MGNRKHKRKSVFLRLVLLGFSIYTIISLGKLQVELINSRRELEYQTAKEAEIKLRNQELLNLLNNGTERDFIERAARDRLGYVYADERVFEDLSGQ